MRKDKKEIIPILIIIIAFGFGFALYSQLPDQIPSHWNVKGEIDSYASKNFTVWFFPSLTLFVYLLMTFLPKIDPLRKNYLRFKDHYLALKIILVAFFTVLYIFALLSGFGMNFNINYFMVPLFSALFILIGAILPNIKRNYFVGIRTPWTIHSESAWDKTHKFSGKIFIVAGVISLLGLLFLDYSIYIFLGAAIGSALVSIVYSYFAFDRK